jgi:hypothetical protein
LPGENKVLLEVDSCEASFAKNLKLAQEGKVNEGKEIFGKVKGPQSTDHRPQNIRSLGLIRMPYP